MSDGLGLAKGIRSMLVIYGLLAACLWLCCGCQTVGSVMVEHSVEHDAGQTVARAEWTVTRG